MYILKRLLSIAIVITTPIWVFCFLPILVILMIWEASEHVYRTLFDKSYRFHSYDDWAMMNFNHYKTWAAEQHCIDCEEKAMEKTGLWATEVQCLKCFILYGNPGRRGIAGAGEKFDNTQER